MKTIKGVIVVLLALAVIGYVGRTDYKTKLYETMNSTCVASNGPTLTTEGRQCNKLILEIENNYNAEVLTDNANYWVEEK